ncbi:MAG: phosphoribosylaminoimidazolesuccinocarboxamide synthase [bacterium]
MEKKELICEGYSKKVYASSDPNMCILQFLDKMLIGGKKKTLKKRGTCNNQVSARLFLYLKSFRVLNHYLKTLSDKEMLVKKLEMFPFRIVIRNVATPDFAKRYGFEKNSPLTPPIFEFFPRTADLKKVAMNESHVYAHGLATQEELRRIKAISTRINAVLVPFFTRRKLCLVEYSLEFGKAEDKVVLGDEISPETMVLWDTAVSPDNKKEMFSMFPNSPEKVYREILKRVTQ